MRVASRIIGVALALAGLGFLLVFPLIVRESVLAGSQSWKGPAFAVILAVGFLLAGWYYFKLDIDALDDTEERPASRFARYLIARHRELRLIALVGFAVSLIRLGALCFGVDWPGLWVRWGLLLIWMALPAAGGDLGAGGRSWLKSVRNVGIAAICILALLWAWSQYSHQQAASRISEATLMVLLFAWESMKSWSIVASSR
jgi:hypothetical protein